MENFCSLFAKVFHGEKHSRVRETLSAERETIAWKFYQWNMMCCAKRTVEHRAREIPSASTLLSLNKFRIPKIYDTNKSLATRWKELWKSDTMWFRSHIFNSPTWNPQRHFWQLHAILFLIKSREYSMRAGKRKGIIMRVDVESLLHRRREFQITFPTQTFGTKVLIKFHYRIAFHRNQQTLTSKLEGIDGNRYGLSLGLKYLRYNFKFEIT